MKTGKYCLPTSNELSNNRNANKLQRITNNNRSSTSLSSLTFNSNTSSDDEDYVYKINTNIVRCKKINVLINKVKCTMDWDPGSVYSIINTQFWKQIGSPQLSEGPKLKAYCNYELKAKGITQVTVEVQGQQQILPVVVMKTNDPMLFGLHWSEKFGMKFPSAVYLLRNNTSLPLQQILDSHDTLFETKLGKVNNYQVNIHIKPGTEPKHLPARPVKFGIKKNRN